MIVSASYRTDIPAFYGRWFLNRLAAGRCRTRNPYSGQLHEVDLSPAAVDGFVFWTKNLGPFLGGLDAVAARGLAFVVQYTITGYPRALETSVTAPDRAVAHVRQVAERFGPRAVVWRYDPIVMTTLTPPAWHRESFAALARALAGATDEVVVSFVARYRKTARAMTAAAAAHAFAWREPPPEEQGLMIGDLAAIAADHGMTLTLCTEPRLAGAAGPPPARCIDARRLGDVAGRAIAARPKGNRPGCACDESRDIGDYDTCPHGCVYCYAVSSPRLARARHRAHLPEDDRLVNP